MPSDPPVLDYARPSRATREKTPDRGTMHYSLGVGIGTLCIVMVSFLTGQTGIPSPAGFFVLFFVVAIVANLFTWGRLARLRISGRRLIERGWLNSMGTGCVSAVLMAASGLPSHFNRDSTDLIWVSCLIFGFIPLASPWVVYRHFEVKKDGG